MADSGSNLKVDNENGQAVYLEQRNENERNEEIKANTL